MLSATTIEILNETILRLQDAIRSGDLKGREKQPEETERITGR